MRIQIELKLAHRIAAIGEKGDLLVQLVPCDWSTSNSRRLGFWS